MTPAERKALESAREAAFARLKDLIDNRRVHGLLPQEDELSPDRMVRRIAEIGAALRNITMNERSWLC
jgi:hypothetical protein